MVAKHAMLCIHTITCIIFPHTSYLKQFLFCIIQMLYWTFSFTHVNLKQRMVALFFPSLKRYICLVCGFFGDFIVWAYISFQPLRNCYTLFICLFIMSCFWLLLSKYPRLGKICFMVQVQYFVLWLIDYEIHNFMLRSGKSVWYVNCVVRPSLVIVAKISRIHHIFVIWKLKVIPRQDIIE